MKFKIFFITSIVSLIGYIWLVEPQWIEINHYQISTPFDDKIRILQISDLHTKGLGSIEKKVIHEIQEIKPDVIVLTGDISALGTTASDYREVLSKMKAPMGVYFVNGNWEYWEKIENFNSTLKELKIINLDNSNKQLTNNIWLIGFDDVLEGRPDEKTAFHDVPENTYKIGIFHTPAYFDIISKKLNLALSGHTHGGQIKFPFLPPLWLPPGSSHYASGWFKKGESSMYVNRGVGTSILPFRLFARPEIAVFHLSKGEVAR